MDDFPDKIYCWFKIAGGYYIPEYQHLSTIFLTGTSVQDSTASVYATLIFHPFGGYRGLKKCRFLSG